MQIHIIYTETEMLLSKRAYASSREIQEEYANYKSSLGPWSYDVAVEYLAAEYLDLSPSADEQVTKFLAAAEDTKAVTFRQQHRTA